MRIDFAELLFAIIMGFLVTMGLVAFTLLMCALINQFSWLIVIPITVWVVITIIIYKNVC
jgi:hypothetical protein